MSATRDATYDLFISYSRRDNPRGQVTELVETIREDFASFDPERELRVFFDVTEIHGMDDWRHRILGGLRSSRLFLCCVSPGYLVSEYCRWELDEYLNHEIARAVVGRGIAPIYFVPIEGWDAPGFEADLGTCCA